MAAAQWLLWSLRTCWYHGFHYSICPRCYQFICALDCLKAGWGVIFRFSEMYRCFMLILWDSINVKPLLMVIKSAWTGSFFLNESEWFSPFHSLHHSIGHFQPHHCWDICCSRRLMYQYFQCVALAESFCYPWLTSWNSSLKRIEAKQQMLSKWLTGVLAQRLHPD